MTDISSTPFGAEGGHHINHCEANGIDSRRIRAIRRPARADSTRLGRPFNSTARTRRAIHQGQIALSRADVNSAEAAGRWALSRLPDPTTIQPGSLSVQTGNSWSPAWNSSRKPAENWSISPRQRTCTTRHSSC